MLHLSAPHKISPGLTMILSALLLLTTTGATAAGRVETLSRFLEFNQNSRILAYEITLRNLESLPVGDIILSALPTCLEGPLEVIELKKGQRFSRRFTFQIEEGRQLFQPRFELAYTKQSGERIRIEPSLSHLAVTIDFSEVIVQEGRVVLDFTLTNPNKESLIFLELTSENPHLPDDTLILGDLKAGQTLHRKIEFEIEPGKRYFNPTLHLNYHAFQSKGTQFHRNFYTILQPDLNRIENALKARGKQDPLN